MKPSLKLRLSRETLRHLQAQEAQHVDGGGATLVSCRIVSCALACPTLSPSAAPSEAAMNSLPFPTLSPAELQAVQGGTDLSVRPAITPVTAISTVDWAAVRPQPDPWRINLVIVH